jgi:hypothetical protein
MNSEIILEVATTTHDGSRKRAAHFSLKTNESGPTPPKNFSTKS